jgi:hypothetical protein
VAETIPYSDQAEKATSKSDVIGVLIHDVASRPDPSPFSSNGKKVNETLPNRIQLTAELATIWQSV